MMFKKIMRSIYRSLPVVRDLRGIHYELVLQKQTLQKIESRLMCTNIIQAIETLKRSNIRYSDPTILLTYGAQYWSQNYEDGMIAEIFQRIGLTARTFVEIGVEDGSETNTTLLLSQGWRGWWFEGNPTSCQSIRKKLAHLPDLSSRLSLRESYVTPENIQILFQEQLVPNEVDLLSLDIDLDTYHIWAALSDFRPRVVIVEYNSAIPPSQNWVNPYLPDRMWDGTQAFGASLKSFELLGRKRGYSLVSCDITGVNAFFVRDDLVGDQFAAPYTAENHYEPPRYGLTYRWGHPSTHFGDSDHV